MSRRSNSLPSYRLHKPSGRAVVTLGGKDFYRGPHGSEASEAEYNRIVAEWVSKGRPPMVDTDSDVYHVNELALAYWKYVNKNVGRIKRMFKWGVQEGVVPALGGIFRLRSGTRNGRWPWSRG